MLDECAEGGITIGHSSAILYRIEPESNNYTAELTTKEELPALQPAAVSRRPRANSQFH